MEPFRTLACAVHPQVISKEKQYSKKLICVDFLSPLGTTSLPMYNQEVWHSFDLWNYRTFRIPRTDI